MGSMSVVYPGGYLPYIQTRTEPKKILHFYRPSDQTRYHFHSNPRMYYPVKRKWVKIAQQILNNILPGLSCYRPSHVFVEAF